MTMVGMPKADAERVKLAETFLRRALGDAQWESFPNSLRRMFVDNSPAILAELRGPWLETTDAELARIEVPTLLVAGQESPPAFRRMPFVSPPRSRTRGRPSWAGTLVDPAEPDVLKLVGEVLST